MKCALIKDDVVDKILELNDEEIVNYSVHYQSVNDLAGVSPQPQVGWHCINGKYLPSLTDDDVEIVCLTVYDPLKDKLRKIKRRFIGENILWGINQAGKTEAVGNFMTNVETWFERAAPLETIKQLEICKAQLNADPTLAASLAPFVTIARLDWYKLEILKALGLA